MSQNRSFTAYDLVEYGQVDEQCYGVYSDSDPMGKSYGLGYSTPCIHSIDPNNIIGVWYNYAATTAGTIATPPNSADTTEASESICPKGWRLPTDTENTNITGNTFVSPFNVVVGGNYDNSTHYSVTTRGFWQSSTAYNAQRRHILTYNNTEGVLHTNDYGRRSNGFWVRCILR